MHRIYGHATSSAFEPSGFRRCTSFFVVRHLHREILHVAVTRCPTAKWTAQQFIECCAWDRWPPRYLIHDRDSRYGAIFERCLRHLGIEEVRTPFRAPRANAILERWVRSVRAECLDHLFIFNEANLRRVMASYVSYFNHWRPHRSLGQRAPRFGTAVSTALTRSTIQATGACRPLQCQPSALETSAVPNSFTLQLPCMQGSHHDMALRTKKLSN
jgi:transposase InsO family protein